MDLKNDANIDESKNIGYELNHKKRTDEWGWKQTKNDEKKIKKLKKDQ